MKFGQNPHLPALGDLAGEPQWGDSPDDDRFAAQEAELETLRRELAACQAREASYEGLLRQYAPKPWSVYPHDDSALREAIAQAKREALDEFTKEFCNTQNQEILKSKIDSTITQTKREVLEEVVFALSAEAGVGGKSLIDALRVVRRIAKEITP